MDERNKFPSGQKDQFVLRLPDGLRDEIKLAAAQSGRSMNAEIVARIQAGDDRKTLRDEFAGRAPDRPEWFEHDGCPARPVIIPNIYGAEDSDPASIAALVQWGVDLNAWRLQREAAWRYVFADAMLAARDAGASPPAPDGYTEAFYEIAALLGIGAKPYSPKEAFERDIKPRLQAFLAAERGGE